MSEYFRLSVRINRLWHGIGFDKNSKTSSLGLTLVKTLAVNQLRGEINIDIKNGVSTTIIWNENE